jgi:DNA modification methylase
VNRIITGECRAVMRELIAQGVKANMVVTSPPYWGLRSYGTPPVVWGGDPACVHEFGAAVEKKGGGIQPGGKVRWQHDVDARPHGHATVAGGAFCVHCGAWRGELGLEPSVFQYIEHMVEVFDLVRELLHDDGVCFVNIGDTYITRPNGGIGENSTINGQGSQAASREASSRMSRQRNRGPLKMKDMALVPQRLAIALQDAGWWVRQDIIWAKPNPMPGSYKDRFTTAHEYVWLLAKSERYFFDDEAVKEPSSPNSHARMARAHGGYAPPGQDKHSGILAPRANRKDLPEGQANLGAFRDAQRAGGVNPKARDRRPGGWAEGAGSHKDLIGRYPRPKQNESFSAVVVDLVGMRRKRDVWTIPTTPYSGSHYATFPEALVEPCILSGTSAHGHCPRCGAGWRRVMGEPIPAPGEGSGNKERKDRSEHGGVPPNGNEAIGKQNQAFGVPWSPSVPVTIGWEPTCDCHEKVRCEDTCLLQPVAAVVFDPFMGTGTVAKVATRLGRNYLGCDLDTKNEALQAERLGGQTMGMALA